MKKNLKRLASSFSKPFHIKTLRKWTKQNFIFPFYHLVSDYAPSYVRHLFPVTSVSQFKKDLDFLLLHFSPANITDVLDYIKNGKKSSSPKFFLSFDDGFSECYSIIAPILLEKGIPAAFFINPAFVDNKQLSHRQKVSLILEELLIRPVSGKTKKIMEILTPRYTGNKTVFECIKNLAFHEEKKIDSIAEVLGISFSHVLSELKPYLGIDQIRKLKEEGFTIGSHSFNHAEFFNLDDKMRIMQINKSFDFIQTMLDVQNRYFSFPFTDEGVPDSFFHYLTRQSNIKVSFGTAGIKNDTAPNHIQRIPIETSGFDSAESIIRAEYFYYLGKEIFGKNTIKRS